MRNQKRKQPEPALQEAETVGLLKNEKARLRNGFINARRQHRELEMKRKEKRSSEDEDNSE